MAEQLDWLKRELAKGLTTFTLLRLKNPPPSEASTQTIEVWFRTLTFRRKWEESLDRARLEYAFLHLAQSCEYFPTPKQLLEALPPREEPRVLPKPPLSQEQRQRNQARIAQLKQQLGLMKCNLNAKA